VQLADSRPLTVLVFGQGVELNGSAMIRGLRTALGDRTTIAGGLAADAEAMERAKPAAEAAAASKTQFLANISDELRTPHRRVDQPGSMA
jgi:signal transduction histidine kinase